MSKDQAKKIISIMIRDNDYEEGNWAFSYTRKRGTQKGDFEEVGYVDAGTFI